jgi:alpha-glutamyl/putrescinyl thymine pyrophosphorylase clade 1
MTSQKSTVFLGGSRYTINTEECRDFFRWVYERNKIHASRQAGKPTPWSEDPIMQSHQFCNVFRIWDRNTQFLLTQVIENGDEDPAEIIFRVFTFRFFNRISTWNMLNRELKRAVSLKTFDVNEYTRILEASFNAGTKLYTSAYIIPSPKLFPGRAFQNHMALLGRLKDEGIFNKLLHCNTMSEAFLLLTSYPGIGSFIGYQ